MVDSDSTIRYKTVTRTVETPQQGAGNVVAKSVSGNINRFNMTVTGGHGSRFYGVALDGHHGVVVDNFSLRGSGGQHLT